MRAPAAGLGLALLVLPALAALVPAASGQPNPLNDERYVYTGEASAPAEEEIEVLVRYADGRATTKFAFNQFEGERDNASGRLDAGAECTEWIGTFTQVQIQAGFDDAVSSASVGLEGYTFPPDPTGPFLGDGTQRGPGFVFDALGTAGVFEGTLTVCDNPDGDGLASFSGTVESAPLADSTLGIVRLIVEDSQ